MPPQASSRIRQKASRHRPPFALLQCCNGGRRRRVQRTRPESRQRPADPNRPRPAAVQRPRVPRHLTPDRRRANVITPTNHQSSAGSGTPVIGRAKTARGWVVGGGRSVGRASGRPAQWRPRPVARPPRPTVRSTAPPGQSGRLIEDARTPDGRPCMKTFAYRAHYEKCVV